MRELLTEDRDETKTTVGTRRPLARNRLSLTEWDTIDRLNTDDQTEAPPLNGGSDPPEYAHKQPDSEVNTPEPLDNKTTRDDINVTLAERLLKKKSMTIVIRIMSVV
ncbi:hypothetical protein ACFQRB_13300 [Halobaculum litoreum]|uniref:Uncharacterized protein n=1 Tax=Halobaculum litoreum TaxID=3031998 RepID=A0ABD5XUF0_9EURY